MNESSLELTWRVERSFLPGDPSNAEEVCCLLTFRFHHSHKDVSGQDFVGKLVQRSAIASTLHKSLHFVAQAVLFFIFQSLSLLLVTLYHQPDSSVRSETAAFLSQCFPWRNIG